MRSLSLGERLELWRERVLRRATERLDSLGWSLRSPTASLPTSSDPSTYISFVSASLTNSGGKQSIREHGLFLGRQVRRSLPRRTRQLVDSQMSPLET